jgi:dihydroorotase
MPNLNPPVRTLTDAKAYKQRIMAFKPANSTFDLLMTIYLTDLTTPAEIIEAKASGIVYAAKLYPAGATTNSQHGVTSVSKIESVLQVTCCCKQSHIPT